MRADRHNSQEGLIQSELNNNARRDLISRVIHSGYDEIEKITHPLFKNTPLTYFCYERIYDTGEIMYLGTGPDLAVKVLIENLFPTFCELSLFNTFGLRATFLSHHMPLPPVASDVNPEKYQKLIAHAAECKTYHALFLIDRKIDHYRLCGFAVKKNIKAIYNFYLNIMPILDNFINYFECHADDLIEASAITNRIIVPNYHDKFPADCILSEFNPPINFSNLDFSVTNPSRVFKSEQPITHRELECLDLVAQGYTMKSIGRKLCISPRTVEQHLRNIKDKYSLNTKDQLVEVWHQLYKTEVSER